MKAMILAAGYGTRLRPLTFAIPKPMVPICNRPLIGYTVEGFLQQGFTEIIVSLHHLPEVLERYLTTTWANSQVPLLARAGDPRHRRRTAQSAARPRKPGLLSRQRRHDSLPPYQKLIDARARRRSRRADAASSAEQNRFAVWFDRGLITGCKERHGRALMFSGAH
jgi:hypothetical protein